MKISKHDQFITKLTDKFGDRYSILSTYIKSDMKIKVKHNVCGYKWDVLPNNLLNSVGLCPQCTGKIKYTTESFSKLISEMTDGEYGVTGEYINTDTRVKMKHLTCGYEWDIFPHSFKSGCRCPRCANRERYTNEDFNQKVKEITDNQYEFIGEYKNNYTKTLFKHNECNTIFEETPITFLFTNKRCPNIDCISHLPNGELKIATYLDKNFIQSKSQYRMEECKNIKSLPFDFAVFKEDGSLLALIEYDGQQHYKPIEWFGGEKAFKGQQKRDKIKNDFCDLNNIPLLRIPYWDENNINQILHEFLTIKLPQRGTSNEERIHSF